MMSRQFHFVRRRYAGSLILALTYGRTAPGRSDDPEIIAVARSLQRVGLAVRPGEYKVDEYPFLRSAWSRRVG